MTETKHITLGVAGHVDHGKTALVRALTGIETDRLKEEQERGMSIVLGFAPLALPGGVADLIDVPGHEKFVRAMIAGASGLDAALLVIAANERIKPQTAEHLALLGLLGVMHGFVVVTKSDLLNSGEERQLVASEVREFLQETFLRDAPILFASALTGDGLSDVKASIQNLLDQAAPPRQRPYCTLPIDRVFTITGHGTVVTGTLRFGRLRIGDEVEIVPRGQRAEVRGLEVHGKSVDCALPGWRTAVNLRGVKKEELSHGDALATPGVLRPTRLLDAELSVLATARKPVKRGQSVTLFHGTAEFPARIYPLGQETIQPGGSALVQFRLAEDAVVPVGERFIIRLPSPAETIGGGRVSDPYPQKHTQDDAEALRRVRVLAQGNAEERLTEKLREAGPAGRDLRGLMLDLGLSSEIAPGASTVLCPGGLALHQDVFERLQGQLRGHVAQFHQMHPLRRGMPMEEARRSLPRVLKPAAFQRLLETLAAAGQLETKDGLARQPGYSPEAALTPVEREIAREIETLFRGGALKPPSLEEALKKDRRRKNLCRFLIEGGALVQTTERASGRTVVFHREAIADAERLLKTTLANGEGLTVSELNAALETTRKFSIPLMEYLDNQGITRRLGDLRYWNERKE